jgi:hypothetical protein
MGRQTVFSTTTARKVCVLWIAGLSASLQLTLPLEGKELTTHRGSPSTSDPPMHDPSSNPLRQDTPSSGNAADQSGNLPPIRTAIHARPVGVLPLDPEDVESIEAYGAVHWLDHQVYSVATLNLNVPPSLESNVACNTTTATVTWAPPSASSTCGGVTLACSGNHLESGAPWDSTRVYNGGLFPAGTNHFCCQATDGCGENLEKCWTITVHNKTAMQVAIEMGPSVATKPGNGLQRCIQFQVFQNCVQNPVTFTETIEFGGIFNLVGHFNGIVMIPSAVHAQCVTARDPHHTLRACYTIKTGDCQPNGILKATMKGDPHFGGNWLVGGNLDGWRPSGRSCFGGSMNGAACSSNANCPGGTCEQTTVASIESVDILDVGTVMAEWMKTYDSNGDSTPDGHTPCGAVSGNHADMNGDGLVDMLDFSFVSMNFLKTSKDCCCPGSMLASDPPRTSIPVNELRRMNRSELIKADINGDGVLDVEDMRAVFGGAR